MVTKTTKLSVLLLAGLFSACSTVKDMTNVDLWPFGKGGEQGHEYMPANSVSFACEGNKKFYVRYLDKGASVWLILPDREVALAQVGSSKVYSNGISKLDLSGEQAALEVNETTKYVGCKTNSVASVSKVEAKPVAVAKTEVKPEAKPVIKAEVKPETSEKGWFDWMKFWESDDKAKTAQATQPAEKVKVAEPVPVTPAVKELAKEEAPVPQVAEPKVAEPLVEATTEQVSTSQADEPAAIAEEKAAPQGDAQVAIAKTVEAWANAWRTKNANAYLNFYSAKFKPEGMSKKAWETQRKQRVGANLAEITLTLDKMSITADAKKATATFAQHYASGKYSDDVMKVLSFENVNGQWLIVKESAR
jgi:hypothetical protein